MADPGAIGGPIEIPSAAQVRINFQMQTGRLGSCVLYGRYAGAFDITQAEVGAMVTALKAGAVWTTLMSFMGTGWSFQSLTVQNVAEANQPIIEAGGAEAGVSPATGLPDETALVLTFRTATTGLSGRGRLYWAGWATNAVGTGGVAAPAAVTALQAWGAANIPAMMAAGGLTHCLGLQARQAYTGSTGTQHAARAATTVDVTAYVVRDNHWDSQRRRGLA